jgi:hypothetical protein
MVKTLRITSVIAVILAGAFFAFPAVFGVRGDEQAEGFLNSAGVIEKFNKLRGQRNEKARDQVSPLVKQAELFARYLNPPKPVKTKSATKVTTPGPRTTPIIGPRPSKVSTKFTLIGTSYYASHPEMSLALIDEPGKGWHWVRQSGKVGHLIIEQVKDGLVVVRDGETTSELEPLRPGKKVSLLKGKTVSSGRAGPKVTLPTSIGPKTTLPVSINPKSALPTSIGPKSASVRKTAGPAKAAVSTINSRHPQMRMGAEESNALDELMNKLQAVGRSPKSDKVDSNGSGEDVKDLMGKLISDFKATRMNAEEAKRLERLGKELKGITEDPNRPRSPKIERPKKSPEPNSPSK